MFVVRDDELAKLICDLDATIKQTNKQNDKHRQARMVVETEANDWKGQQILENA